MASRALLMACLRSEARNTRDLSPRPRYPSMPRYPKGAGPEAAKRGNRVEDAEEPRSALFSVAGMSCAACAGSVEKAVKRLPGIHDAAVDVLNGRAQVLFYPSFVDVRRLPPTPHRPSLASACLSFFFLLLASFCSSLLSIFQLFVGFVLVDHRIWLLIGREDARSLFHNFSVFIILLVLNLPENHNSLLHVGFFPWHFLIVINHEGSFI